MGIPWWQQDILHTICQKEDEGLEVFLQLVLSVCLDDFPQTDAITLQHVATEASLRGTKHWDEAIVVINESPTNIQQACKQLKTLIANKQAISGQIVSFKESFTAQEEDRVSHIEKRLDSFPEASMNPPVGGDVCIRGEIALLIILGKEIIGSLVTAKDHHLIVGTGLTIISEGIMSHVIGIPGGAILHSRHSVMIIGVGTLLVGFLCRIGNMGWGVHIVNTPHPIVAIPEVSMTDRVEIITLFLASHTISLQITKDIGFKTMCPKV